MKKVLFLMLFLSLWGTVCLNAQVTIGDNKEPEKFSALEIISNGSNALRLPQLTTVQRDDMTTDDFKADAKSTGLVIYNTTTQCFDFWNGSTWISLCAPTSIELTCGTIFSQGAPVAVGSAPGEIISVIPPSGGSAPYTYLWQSCTGDPAVPGNWVTASGINNGANYQPAALNNTTYFRRQITDAVGAVCVSNVVKVQVTLVAGTITQPGQLPLGGGTVTINGTASTGGFSGTVYRLWEYCMNGCSDEANWYPVTDNTGGYTCSNNGTGQNYSSCPITSDMQIRRRDMDGEQAQVTNTVLVTVRTSNPTGTASDITGSYTGSTVCQDSPASFTVTLVPTVTSPVVIVYDSNGNQVDQKASAPFTFTVNPPTAPATTYYVAFKGSNYDENLATDRKPVSIPVTAKVTPSVTITSDKTNNTINQGESITFTATPSNLGGGTVSNYNWKVNGNSVTSGNNNTYQTSSLSNSNTVSCEMTVSGGCTSYSVATYTINVTVQAGYNNNCADCKNFLLTTQQYASTHFTNGSHLNGYCRLHLTDAMTNTTIYEWRWLDNEWKFSQVYGGTITIGACRFTL